MTGSSHPLFSRPGGLSAKSVRRVGALNNLHGSGEILMVGNEIEGVISRAVLWDLAKAQTRVVMGLRQENAELAQLLWDMAASKAREANAHAVEVETVRAERDAYLRANGHLVKACMSLSDQVADLRAARNTSAAQVAHHEMEVLELIDQRDRAQARVRELQDELDRQGGVV
jgi:hypothetical protein